MTKIHITEEDWEGDAPPASDPVHTLGLVQEQEDAQKEKAKLEEKLTNGD